MIIVTLVLVFASIALGSIIGWLLCARRASSEIRDITRRIHNGQ